MAPKKILSKENRKKIGAQRKKTKVSNEPKPSSSKDFITHQVNEEICNIKSKKRNLSPTVEFEENVKKVRKNSTSMISEISPIAHLNPFQNKWTIKVRVVAKRSIYSWNNSKGTGKLFSINLMDSSAQIRATAFQHLVNRFYDKFEQNKIYTINGADIKNANKTFSKIKNNFELFFNDDTKIESCHDENAVPEIEYNFTAISQIHKAEKNSLINVIGICHEIKAIEEFTAKSTGNDLKKREFSLIDDKRNGIQLIVYTSQTFFNELKSLYV